MLSLIDTLYIQRYKQNESKRIKKASYHANTAVKRTMEGLC